MGIAYSRTIVTLHISGAVVLACALVYFGTILADAYQLPFIHGWALAHGAIFVVFPIYLALSYFMLLPLVRPFYIRSGAVPAETGGRVSLLAISALVFSGFSFLVPVLGSLITIFLGHLARRRCRSEPSLSGANIALCALVLGYIGLAYSLYIVGVMSWVATNAG
jgi:hypothetical protein